MTATPHALLDRCGNAATDSPGRRAAVGMVSSDTGGQVMRTGARAVNCHWRRADADDQGGPVRDVMDPDYHAAAKMLAGEPFKKEAVIAKLAASGAAVHKPRDATQVFGGYGFMNEYPVGRFCHDAKILEIGEGTSEIQRMLIARELGLTS